MFLRALTADEVDHIKTAKRDANEILKDRRKELTARMKKSFWNKLGYKKLQEDLHSIRTIEGKPVKITVDGYSMLIDYALLKKFDRMLDPRKWQRSVAMKIVSRERVKAVLTIQYQKDKQSGVIELYELPAYQMELLKDLPEVEVTEWF